jgi:hypothetical protein
VREKANAEAYDDETFQEDCATLRQTHILGEPTEFYFRARESVFLIYKLTKQAAE